MLLSPRSATGEYCTDLKLNVASNTNPREFYSCKMDSCIPNSKCYYSSVRDTRCHDCGKLMDKVRLWKKVETLEDGVFVKKNSAKFIITDDFHVKPVSVLHYYDMLKEFAVGDLYLIEERTLEFGKEELLNLLKKLLEGKKLLTRICFPDLCIQYTTPIYKDVMELRNYESEGNKQLGTGKLQIKLIMNRTHINVVCAELEEEFADQLFSFLTFPLGSVLKLICYSNSLGCMVNLYNSIQELKLNWFKSVEAKNMLISPELPLFFGYNKQMLDIKEESPYVKDPLNSCLMCKWNNENVPLMTKCKHGVQITSFEEINPKIAKKDKNLDGRFVSEAQIFLVMDDLLVTPMSFLSFNKILKKHRLKVDHLEKREMTIGKTKVCGLLKAMLISKTVLSDVLSPYIRQVGDME